MTCILGVSIINKQNVFILGEKLADEEVGELLNGHEDSQGNVNYEEFVRAVMSG
jgi:Ca2+-binding EF-hand superfamily protein